jgi:hypothetical protein
MGILAVTFVAIRRGVGDRRNLTDLVAKRGMAGRTLDLMIRDVFPMKGLRRIFCHEYLRFVMAFKTLSLRHMGIPLNHTEMTLLASHSSINIFTMVEIPALDIDVAFWRNVAGGATSHCTGDAVLFPLWTGLIVVTDEAVGFMDREVGSLNDLGMAGGAAKFHPSSQFAQVFSVGEGHILVDHIFLKIFCPMTTLLHTTRIADLSVRPARPFSGDEIG